MTASARGTLDVVPKEATSFRREATVRKLALFAALALAFAAMATAETVDSWLADRTLTIEADCTGGNF